MNLTIPLLLERSERHSATTASSRACPTARVTRTAGASWASARRLASRLDALGIAPGERVATFAWNGHRHLELYFALPCSGRVAHTVNLRLADEHIAFVLNHSEDVAVFVDADQLPLIERIAGQLRTVRQIIVLGDAVPQTSLRNVLAYEDLVAAGDAAHAFPDLPEDTPAGMCYTSATTGAPKGVIYTHRDIFLHTMAECMADALAIRERDTIRRWCRCSTPMVGACPTRLPPPGRRWCCPASARTRAICWI